MARYTLILEGLPEDFDQIRSRLELYFKNKRRSGGEILEILKDPADKRKAQLIYLDNEDFLRVLATKNHQIDFKKTLGVVKLQVKPKESTYEVKTAKPTVSPCHKEDPAQNAEHKAVSSCQADSVACLHAHELLVSTEQKKDFLVMYFEQFVMEPFLTIHGKNRWILKLSSCSDVKKVLAKKGQDDYGISVSIYKEKDVELDSRRFILTGFDNNCPFNMVSLYIGSCSQGADHVWEILDDGDSIVVTFKQDIDVENFMSKCSSKKCKDMEIVVSRLKMANSVLVHGDFSQITEETLCLYFTNKRSKGGEIKSLIWVTKNKSVVITYEDCHIAQNVVEHKHTLCGVELVAQLFYPSFQKALTGHKTNTDIPTHVIILASKETLEFINCSHDFKQEFTSALKTVHADVSINLTSKPPHIELTVTLDKECLGLIRLGHTWEMTACREARNLLEKYKEIHIRTEEEVWERAESRCVELSSKNVKVAFNKSTSEIGVIGLQHEVKHAVENIENMLKKVNDDLQTERDVVERKITFKSKKELEFILDLVSSKLVEVGITKDEESFTIILKGSNNNVNKGSGVIEEMQATVVIKELNLSGNFAEFLLSQDLKKFENDHFVQNHISSILIPTNETLQILAEQVDLQKAVHKLEEVIKEEFLELTTEQANAIKSQDWKRFLAGLNTDLESSCNHQNVRIILSDSKISVCGFSSVVLDVSTKVRGYLENKKPTTVEVPIKSLQEIEFLESCMHLSDNPDLKALGAVILPNKTPGSYFLNVTAASDKIGEATRVVKSFVNGILTNKYKYSNAGECKVLKNNQIFLEAKAKELKCKLNLCLSPSPQPISLRQFKYDICSGITLTIAEGSIPQHSADALVCPLNKMAFDNPLAQQFLQSGGPVIKKDFDELLKKKRSLNVGDVVMTNPGKLKAKKLIYAAIPVYSGILSFLKYSNLDKAALQSIKEADSNHCVTIGMPALGCGTFGFSVKDSCEAVINGIIEFNKCKTNSARNLRDVYVIDSDAKIVEEFKSAVEAKGYLQSHLTSTGTHTQLSASNISPPPLPVTSCRNPKLNVDGVTVILKKGDILNEAAEIIVNSTNKNLDLNSGVSGAILKAAGKSVVDQCQKHGPQPADGVVLTGGGNLKCKHIAHMVGPTNVADITSSIEKVLQLCQTKNTVTVSIPTVGTGNGGIDPKHSMKAIVQGVKNYLSKTTLNSIKIISIVAFEQKIFDVMQNYFDQKNRSQKINQARAALSSTPYFLPINQVKIHGVRIELRKGDITYETVRGIVNTTNANLNLTGGVSAAIFRAAGNSIKLECQNICPLKGNEIAVTSGGDLQCDFILHMLGPHSVADATIRVTKALERCEEHDITTVSFPAVGTGGGGLNGTDSVGAILQGIADHLHKRLQTVLKLMYIVIDQDNIEQEFRQGFTQWKSNQAAVIDSNNDDDSSDGQVTSSDSDSKVNTIEAVLGPVKVKVLCGDITQEKTDAIVSSTNTSLNLNTGVSGAILKAAGQTVIDECAALGTQADDGVVMTKPGNLHTKHIVHMVGQTKEDKITSSMLKVLEMCADNKIQSVSFPALGTGAGNLGAANVAHAMLAAIKSLLLNTGKPSVKTVHIVVFQKGMLKDFQEAIKKLRKVSPKSSAKTKKSAKQLFSTKASSTKTQATSTQQPSLCLASACRTVSFPPIEVEVISCINSSLDEMKKLMDDVISRECSSEELTTKHLSLLQEKEKQAILVLSQTKQVQVEISTPNKVIVSGKSDDVLAVVIQIKDFLHDARERENRANEENRLKETVCWEAGEGETWVELDQGVSLDLEVAFHDQKMATSYSHQGERYTVDLKSMQQTDSKGTIVRLKRTLKADAETAVIQPPASWTRIDHKDLSIIDLASTSEEYKKVESEFIQTSKNPNSASQQTIQVVKIQRIQSTDQWQRYAVKKLALDKKYPTNKNELNLYHGTTADICQKINTNGFNRSFCGRNATVYGNGTYFARESWYSCQDIYSNPDASGFKYMYRARVLVGKPCLGTQGLIEPLPLDPNDPTAGLHDCTVNNLQNPFIYVVFLDAGAYPDYLITFKTS